MEEYTKREKRIDLACLVLFPLGFVILAILAYAGYSPAYFAETYVAYTQLISAVVVMVLPTVRLTGRFRAPYWFVAVITSVPYLHAGSLFFGLYKNFEYWDFISHSYSSAVVTMVVFLALLIINHYATRIKLGGRGILVGTFLLGHGFGNAWELWEWVVDCYFGDRFMSYNVVDTIGDLCFGDAFGVLVMTIVVYFIMLNKDCNKIVDGMNLGEFMNRAGRRWDRLCINEDPGSEDDPL